MSENSPAIGSTPDTPIGAGSRPLPDGVEWTAVLVAAQRAAESLSQTPAFRDPLAEAVMTYLGLAEPGRAPHFATMPGQMSGMTEAMGDLVTLRTLYLDEALTRSGLDQVVLLGAGLDGRAYRMPWTGRRVFEVDRPAGLALKEQAADAAGLSAVARRTSVPVDLAEDWPQALVAAGFDPARPAAWVAEGLTVYLTRAEADLMMSRVHDLSAPGSRLCVEIAQPLGTRLDDAATSDAGVHRTLSVLRYGPPTPPHDWIAGHGWSPDASTLAELGDRYHRKVGTPFDPARGGVNLWYFNAELLPRR
ncbi:SAM-dependent methyltransferase [Actinoplanes friuliensis]|uniref:S-adenosyl-L-methionine-dependent methyltransferase n=1 Tax=Actinoplanes friuliensis DSM 7358 TaxID=1246995 RepID=U5VVI7_9ACTN|nr:SAM-dependent methyltransferase [Actinoplanes friuliensis]AGZ40822.1 methyltransferase [Actinoplanes friuliensis DSM 7358]